MIDKDGVKNNQLILYTFIFILPSV